VSFKEKVKSALRGWFLTAARSLGEKPDAPAIRKSKNIFLTDIKVPVWLSLLTTFFAVAFMFVMDIGLSWTSVIAMLIFISVFCVYFAVSFNEYGKNIFADKDAVVLLCMLLIIGILSLQISEYYSSVFIFPLAAFAVMASMLLSARIGILYAFVLSVIAGMLFDIRFDIFLFMFAGSVCALWKADKIRKRSDFIFTGIRIVVVNALIICMFYLLNVYSVKEFTKNIVDGSLNAVLTVIILLAFMPLFEKLFSRTTNIKLIELADFNNDLLKKLMIEAPGTYHHSLMVAAIAEQAADAIGANSILVRVCSYYHDIGKIKNPEYFIENQAPGSKNPHDLLTPQMSALILVSHVKDGIFMASRANLDKEIIDNIAQHHGTTMIRSFYLKAVETNDSVDIENFRYSGPKPQTREAAIIMIADSCEAACKALEDPTAVRIKETVEKIVNNKFTDGQFSDCPITLKDLQIISDSAIDTLVSIYHARIEYKDKDKD